MNTPAPVEQTEESAVAEETVTETLVDDVLVEEVSIDGMCGVY